MTGKGHTERAIFIVDGQGIIQYIDIHDISKQPPNSELFDAIRKFDPAAAAGEPAAPEDVTVLPQGGIVMYCTPWCEDCKKARAWLAEKGLAYTEVDISRSNRAANQVRAWANGNQTTPTFEINGTVVVDFNEARLKEVLKI